MAGRWVKQVSEAIEGLEDDIAELLWLERHLRKAFVKTGDKLDEIALRKVQGMYQRSRNVRERLPGGREWAKEENGEVAGDS